MIYYKTKKLWNIKNILNLFFRGLCGVWVMQQHQWWKRDICVYVYVFLLMTDSMASVSEVYGPVLSRDHVVFRAAPTTAVVHQW